MTTVVVQCFAAPGSIVDNIHRKSRVTYIKLRCNENKGSHSLSQFITTCTSTVACALAAMPYQTVGSNQILAMYQRHLNYSMLFYHTNSKVQKFM